MIQYLRIPKNKFWGWVFTSLATGLILGAGITYAVGRAGSAKQIENLKQQLASQVSSATSQTAGLKAQLSSVEASLTATSQEYAELQSKYEEADQSSDEEASSAQTLALEVLSRKIRPSTVATGDNITLTAEVQGKPDRVTMRIRGKTRSFDETYSLKKTSSSSNSQTWKRTISAPKKTGTYTYYATAYRDGESATKPGTSPSTLTVK